MSSRSGDRRRSSVRPSTPRSTRRRPSKPERIARLAILLLIGVVAAVVATRLRSPFQVTEESVRAMVRRGTLVGLSLEDAATRLQHEPPSTRDGLVNFDFAHLRLWSAGTLQLDVREGRVVSATWLPPTRPTGPE